MGAATRGGSRGPLRPVLSWDSIRSARETAARKSRSAVWIAVIAVVCIAVGICTGANPKLGLEITIGLGFAVAVLSDLTLGIVLFTVLSFLEVINSGGAALSFTKLAGLVLFVSWYAALAVRTDGDSRSLGSEQPLLVIAVIAFLGWSLLSVLWAESHGAAFTATERYLLNILLLPIVFGAVRRREQFVWIVGAFIFGADVSAIYGFLASAGGRLSGAIGDPNELAAVLIAAFLLSLPMIANSRPGSARRFASVLGCVVAVIGLLYADSRGGFIAFGCTLLAAAVLGGRWRRRAVVLLLVSAALGGIYFGLLAPSSARQHLSSANTSGRSDLWKVGLRMFSAQPLNGVGSGNFPVASIHYVQSSGSLTRADLIVAVPHVTHDLYLEVADELGLPGLMFLLVIAAAAMAAALRAARRYEQAGDRFFEMLSRALLLSIFGALVADVFLSGEYSKQFWLLIALAAPLLALAPRAPTDGQVPART